jgi:hypothetical protein
LQENISVKTNVHSKIFVIHEISGVDNLSKAGNSEKLKIVIGVRIKEQLRE